MAAGDYKGTGDRIQWTAGSVAIAAGDPVVVRSGATGMMGIALTDIAALGTGTVAIEGVFEVTKATTTALGIFTNIQTVYWDVAGGHFNSQASANIPAGIAFGAAAAADTTMKIKLIPSKAT